MVMLANWCKWPFQSCGNETVVEVVTVGLIAQGRGGRCRLESDEDTSDYHDISSCYCYCVARTVIVAVVAVRCLWMV